MPSEIAPPAIAPVAGRAYQARACPPSAAHAWAHIAIPARAASVRARFGFERRNRR